MAESLAQPLLPWCALVVTSDPKHPKFGLPMVHKLLLQLPAHHGKNQLPVAPLPVAPLPLASLLASKNPRRLCDFGPFVCCCPLILEAIQLGIQLGMQPALFLVNSSLPSLVPVVLSTLSYCIPPYRFWWWCYRIQLVAS